MNNERVEYLLAYLSELTKLTTNDYRCNTEIAECIGWIREEFEAYNLSPGAVAKLAQMVNTND